MKLAILISHIFVIVALETLSTLLIIVQCMLKHDIPNLKSLKKRKSNYLTLPDVSLHFTGSIFYKFIILYSIYLHGFIVSIVELTQSIIIYHILT